MSQFLCASKLTENFTPLHFTSLHFSDLMTIPDGMILALESILFPISTQSVRGLLRNWRGQIITKNLDKIFYLTPVNVPQILINQSIFPAVDRATNNSASKQVGACRYKILIDRNEMLRTFQEKSRYLIKFVDFNDDPVPLSTIK